MGQRTRNAGFLAKICLSLMLGCGSEKECDVDVIHGTYLAQYTLIDGTCGPQTGGLVTLTTLKPSAPSGCTFQDSGIDFMACKGDSDMICIYVESDRVLNVTTALKLEDPTGDTITGVMSLEVTTWQTLETTCTGNYRVTYTRQ